MTSLHTFVIAWPGFHDNAARIEEGVGRDVTVLNTDEGAHEPHWVLQPREAFYSARWNKVLELCRSDVIGIVCADVASTSWSRLMARARDAFAQLPQLGLYAPFVDTHYWLADKADLTCVAGDVYESPATNGVCWFVKADVARAVGPVDLSVNPLGWGIDFVAGAIARQMGYVIGVDAGVAVRHPAGTSYDCADALSQMEAYLGGFGQSVQDDVRGLMEQGTELRERYVQRRAVPKWFDELADFRLALHTAEPYVDEAIAQETAALSSHTDAGTYTWMIHMYPPKHNAGAEMMTHAINSYLIRQRQAHVNVIQNEQSVATYDRVNLIWAKDRVGCTRAVHEANVLLSHLDNEPNAAQTAVRARKPLVLVMHNSGRDPWIEEFKKILPGNLYLVHNSLWIQKYYARHGLPGVVLYPPVDWRDYLVESSREYVTLINLSENKGGHFFLQLVQRMPDIQFLGVKGAYDPQLSKDYRNLTLVENTPHIKDVYSRTGILLMPSKYESWGRTAVEAMSSGIPVIAHPTPGLVESCRDAGIFCSRDDLDAWEREIRRLRQDEAYCAERSEACTRRAMELDPGSQLAAVADWLAALNWKEPLM